VGRSPRDAGPDGGADRHDRGGADADHRHGYPNADGKPVRQVGPHDADRRQADGRHRQPGLPALLPAAASGNAPAPWKLGDPTNGQGFESAVAYAVAQKLGYTQTDVAWTVVPFDNSYAPGAKPFDFYLAQVSYTTERAQAVDMSDGYYFVNQSIVALKSNPIASAKTIADLKQYKFGAQVGTTAYTTIQDMIAPTAKPSVYNTNDAAIQALKAKQIDGLVVDLPTAFYITSAQLDNSVIVGQFPATAGPTPSTSVWSSRRAAR